MRKDYYYDLRVLFGIMFDALQPLSKEVLSVIYKYNHYSQGRTVTAKRVAFDLWGGRGGNDDIRAFDVFYRQVRKLFNRLKDEGFIQVVSGSRGYELSLQAADGVLRSNT